MAEIDDTGNVARTKADKAIVYMEQHNVGAPTAAKFYGISAAAVYRRIKNLQETSANRCPCCGSLMKNSKAKEI